MRQIIRHDIKSILCSTRFWLSVAVIILSAVVNLINVQHFDKSEKFGAFGLFIYGCIDYNPLMSYIAPFIPAVVFSTIDIFPFKGVNSRDLKGNLLGHSISSTITGSLVFLFSFLIILAGCFIYDPSTLVTYYKPLGLFADVYDLSIPIYITLFVIHSVIFGAVYSLFGIGITLITKSDSFGLVLPGVIYHSIYYIGTFISQTFLAFTAVLFPVMPFNFGGLDVPLWKNSLDLGLTLVMSAIFIIIGYSNMKKNIQPTNLTQSTTII